jgi:GNAT superfamily N-acetyltransferase
MDELDAGTDVMSRAFLDDPFWTFLLVGVKRRERRIGEYFRVLLKVGIGNGAAFGIGDPLHGVALWTLPRDERPRPLVVGNLGYSRLLFGPMAPLTCRALPLFVKVAELQRRFAPGPHYYLESIAVDPEAHGQRLASRLIRPFLERADTRSLPCYTETMAKGNVPIYEHFGFEVVDRYAPPEKGPRVWSMLRRPRPRSLGLRTR